MLLCFYLFARYHCGMLCVVFVPGVIKWISITRHQVCKALCSLKLEPVYGLFIESLKVKLRLMTLRGWRIFTSLDLGFRLDCVCVHMTLELASVNTKCGECQTIFLQLVRV
jgi:hypothetical protein